MWLFFSRTPTLLPKQRINPQTISLTTAMPSNIEMQIQTQRKADIYDPDP